jgi:hypothetical protein
MENSGDDDRASYERARFYSRDEIVDEQANSRAMLAAIVEQLPPLPFYLRRFESESKERRELLNFLEVDAKAVGRPLTQEEARQLANYNYKVYKTVIAFLPPPVDVDRTLTNNLRSPNGTHP